MTAPETVSIEFQSNESLVNALKSETWFHNFCLGSINTGSIVYGDSLQPNYHLLPTLAVLKRLNIGNLECMDVGTFDGLGAFAMAELGAKIVHATCQFDLRRFRLIKETRGLNNVTYHPKVELEQLNSRFANAGIDLILMTAMMHQLVSPLEALLIARSLIKPNGYLILESVRSIDDITGSLFNPILADPVFGSPTIWIPSLSTLKGMLEFSFFEVIEEIELLGGRMGRETNYDRVTIVARARKPAELKSTHKKITEIHNNVKQIGTLSISELNSVETHSLAELKSSDKINTFNIWTDSVDISLQPKWTRPTPEIPPVKIARNSDLAILAAKYPQAVFDWKDISLLSARYPGEPMPESMKYSLKQMGNLFVLDMIEKWGLVNVLEAGPGFNHYFLNKSPRFCRYHGLDSPAFYNSNILETAKAQWPADRFFDGYLGSEKNSVPDQSMDCVFSVSVLEHVPVASIDDVCSDAYRMLRPGGWTLHSIDVRAETAAGWAEKWTSSLVRAGFLVGESTVAKDIVDGLTSPNAVLTEPLDIQMRFYGGYRKTIYAPHQENRASPATITILVAGWKSQQ